MKKPKVRKLVHWHRDTVRDCAYAPRIQYGAAWDLLGAATQEALVSREVLRTLASQTGVLLSQDQICELWGAALDVHNGRPVE